MKVALSILFYIILVTGNLYSQSVYEMGYIIKSNGQKVLGELLNEDWKDNPTKIWFRESAKDSSISFDVKDLIEFGTEINFKYVVKTIKMDNTFLKNNPYTLKPGLEFTEFTWALKTLVEGEASLYIVKDGNYDYFFISIKGNEPVYLMYKFYSLDNGNKTRYEEYKNQLEIFLSSDEKMNKIIKDAKYSEESLKKVFQTYLSTNNSVYTNYEYRSTAKSPSLHVRLSYDYNTRNDAFVNGYKGKISPIKNVTVGVDYIRYLRQTQNKWAGVMGLAFNYSFFDGRIKIREDVLSPQPYVYKESIISLNLGLRRYVSLLDKHSLFIQTDFVTFYSINNKLTYNNGELNPGNDGVSPVYLNLAAGYEFNELISASVHIMPSIFSITGIHDNKVLYVGSTLSVRIYK